MEELDPKARTVNCKASIVSVCDSRSLHSTELSQGTKCLSSPVASNSGAKPLFDEEASGIIEVSANLEVLSVNGVFLDWMGWDLEGVLGSKLSSVFQGEFGACLEESCRLTLETGEPQEFHALINTRNNTVLSSRNFLLPVYFSDQDCFGARVCFTGGGGRTISKSLTSDSFIEFGSACNRAAEIAHDVNNLLHAIMGFNKFLTKQNNFSDVQRQLLLRIQKATERASSLVSGLISHSSKPNRNSQKVNVNALIGDVANIIRSAVSGRNHVEVYLPRTDVFVGCVDIDLFRILLNLALNAQEAVPGPHDKIRLSLELVSCCTQSAPNLKFPDSIDRDDRIERESHLRSVYRLNVGGIREDGDVAKISIRNPGSGIRVDQLEKIFDPNISNKNGINNFGLGLSIVKNIVKSYNWYLEFITDENDGTEVKLYLPVS